MKLTMENCGAMAARAKFGEKQPKNPNQDLGGGIKRGEVNAKVAQQIKAFNHVANRKEEEKAALKEKIAELENGEKKLIDEKEKLVNENKKLKNEKLNLLEKLKIKKLREMLKKKT